MGAIVLDHTFTIRHCQRNECGEMTNIISESDLIVKRVSNGWVVYKVGNENPIHLMGDTLQFYKFVSNKEELNEIIGSIEESENLLYRPLPPCLTISQSAIQGLGLFATEDISEDTEFGITHIRDRRFQDGYIRTPLGGFFNHSEHPNAEAYMDQDYIKLRAIRSIKSGEEITVRYWLYNIKEMLK